MLGRTQKDYTLLKDRRPSGGRSRDLALNLSFLTWMHWAEPPFVTGLSEDPKAINLWHEAFSYLGGEQSSDCEVLFVFSLMAGLFPYVLGAEDEWSARADRIKTRLDEIYPLGLPANTFDVRGEYGQYFDHQRREGRSS